MNRLRCIFRVGLVECLLFPEEWQYFICLLAHLAAILGDVVGLLLPSHVTV